MLQLTQFINIWTLLIDVVAFGCLVAGTVGREWYIFVDDRNPRNPIELTFGLWRRCRITLFNDKHCSQYDLNSDEQWVKIVQLLTVLSCVLVALSLLITVAVFRRSKLTKWSITLRLTAGKFFLIDCAVSM